MEKSTIVVTMAGLAYVMAAIAIVLGLISLLNIGLSRQEEAECYQWQNQAKHYAGFYLTQWQSEQCLAHGISIDAPIK
ncbi:MAG: hypothetical protein KGL39_35325 [Patescibacteria group bacterium]|nr:hypothetical protein [Patescibacteria group bacterium]